MKEEAERTVFQGTTCLSKIAKGMLATTIGPLIRCLKFFSVGFMIFMHLLPQLY